ncbi:MAG: enoyl-CoA hydratase/isomerase family protein [Pseudorhodoplanes sp.]|nr:Fatty acid oxidation complex subunit alpha [Pseudorhodoplanes sp.]MCL4710279.1 enoyl-CoA hydratase/isomerase family protein [Pseudorhodoplanes sp.]MCQ3941723.1 3-hydroxyacyl-CoA dehydrogenase [Alphaproteobacteria bacterium]GIK79399.1 MAG: 3-hydroxyacyl-CoA dehydrogenase [Alphaproteobacteria bacterium]
MPGQVELRRDGNIAVIVVDNPPVNALSHDLRTGLIDAFTRARDDATVEAIVLAAAGRTFIAGADITEFDKPPTVPTSMDVIALIDGIGKPVVAAVHGTPLGGGLEVALGCHFRVAAPGTKLGLPEIKLGLIPGAGGTQRLPRLVGMEKAAQMILTGNPIPAKDALAAGLVDEIVEGDIVAGGIAFARKVLAEKRPLRRVRDRDDKLAALRADPKAFEEIVAAHLKRGRGLHAPAAAIKALRWALDVPFDEALRRERETFLELRGGDQAKSQRHIFFAEREAAKVPGLGPDVKAREIRRAAVIGAGTMGGGIAMCFANAGIPVALIETSEDALKRGLGIIEKNYRATAARGGLTEAQVGERLALFNGVTGLDQVAGADMIVEAVFEDMDIKRQVFEALDRFAPAHAVLATNTSYLDVDAIAQTTKRPAAVVGMHFFSPANVMRLLEVVRGAQTAPETLATALAVGRKIGKVPVVVGVCHGFVGNRMLRARSVEAERLLLEGALPQDVDSALTDFGFPMGPFAMSDLAGLDISWRMRKAQGARAEIADQLCEAGRFGQKTQKGFYLYEQGSRTPRPDPEVEALIVATSKRLGIARRPFERQEIVERLVFPMINEGARILEEGIALRAGDIDVIWIHGYGFPVWRGGPMFHADTLGLPYVRDRLAAFARQTGDPRHEPAALLTRLASEGRGFGSLPKG